MAQVLLEKLKKTYDNGFTAVHGMDLDILDGEFLVLVGPSGCGKTTTLRMVAGLEEVTSGRVIIDERTVNDVPPKDRDIAMVFQNYALYPHMSVYKNLAFGLLLRKMPKKEIDARVRRVAERLEITEQLDKKPKALSGGQRQRVALGRALVREPKAFLLDEPLSNLDAKLRIEMRKELKLLHQELGSTMIYVTHDQIEAMTLGDRIVVMSGGHMQQADKPLEIYNRPVNKFVAGFIGTPPMNFLSGTLVGQNGSVAFDEGEATIPLPDSFKARLDPYMGKKATLGVRPEDIAIAIGETKPGHLPATVKVVEPLGDQLMVYLSSETNSLIGKLPAHTQITHGDKVSISYQGENVHVFETDTDEERNVTIGD
jgi:multiple sugar transport system ATP-binding protein